jgi:hypothetical protein
VSVDNDVEKERKERKERKKRERKREKKREKEKPTSCIAYPSGLAENRRVGVLKS